MSTVEQLMRLRLAGDLELLLGRGRVETAKVVHVHRKLAVADPLGAVGEDLDTQHRMARSESHRCGAQTVGVHPRAVELHVQVCGDAAELLFAVAAQPHCVLNRSQRERGVRVEAVDGGCVGLRRRLVAGVLGDQIRPRGDRGICCQRGEPEVDALLAPASRQRHHPDGVEPRGDEVGLRIEVVGADAEQFSDLVANSLSTCRTCTHSGPSEHLVKAALTLSRLPYIGSSEHIYPEGLDITVSTGFQREQGELIRGFVPFPEDRAEEYRTAGYWRGRALETILRDAAAQWPDKPAVIDATGSHTFAELDALADRMAAALADRGVAAG